MGIDWTDHRVPLTPAIQDELTHVSGLLELTGWRDLGGSWSTNIGADLPGTAGGLVFRVHQRSVTSERLSAEQHARKELASMGLPTVVALPIFAGSTIARLRAGNLVEVEPLVKSDARMNTPETLVRGFAVLGALHDGLQAAPPPAAARTVTHANHLDAEVTVARTQAGVARIRSWGDPQLTVFADSLADHVTRLCRQEDAYRSGQHRQVVHGDFWDNNVLFADGDVTAVLDFGFMAEHARVDDLALPIWYHLLGHPESPEAQIAVAADMLKAYDKGSKRPLTTAERLSLPLVIARQPAWLVGRWVLFEDEVEEAQAHARRAAAQFPTAVQVLENLVVWQRALTS